jgi:hypothetical protein
MPPLPPLIASSVVEGDMKRGDELDDLLFPSNVEEKVDLELRPQDQPTHTVSHMLPSGYSLTWPIWHLLPKAEKVRIARLQVRRKQCCKQH